MTAKEELKQAIRDTYRLAVEEAVLDAFWPAIERWHEAQVRLLRAEIAGMRSTVEQSRLKEDADGPAKLVEPNRQVFGRCAHCGREFLPGDAVHYPHYPIALRSGGPLVHFMCPKESHADPHPEAPLPLRHALSEDGTPR